MPPSKKCPPRINAPPPPPFFEIFKINASPPPPQKGAFIRNILLFPANAKHKNINDETLHDNPFEDIVEAAPSFNLIDEENNDEKLKIS